MFVEFDFERIRVLLDKPCQRVPILLRRQAHANLVPPHLTARFGFVHHANICGTGGMRSPPSQGPFTDRIGVPAGEAQQTLHRLGEVPPWGWTA